MSHPSSRNFLRAARRAAGFSQSELATLLGMKDRYRLARIERGEHAMELEHVLRYEVLFGQPIARAVPDRSAIVRNELWEDITAALGTCAEEYGRRAEHRRDVLLSAQNRIESVS